ncbi:MAG: hypothetical protein JW870_16720 [Candidatus Delongbacteria bacterium]|nr:hypothetical protein [Candidatus Delongbacteria bacterium]
MKMMKGAVQDKSFDFSVRVVNLYKYLTAEAEKKEFVMSITAIIKKSKESIKG